MFFANAVSYIAVIAGLLLMRVPRGSTGAAGIGCGRTWRKDFVLFSGPDPSWRFASAGTGQPDGNPLFGADADHRRPDFSRRVSRFGAADGRGGRGRIHRRVSLARRVGLKGYGRSIGLAPSAWASASSPSPPCDTSG